VDNETRQSVDKCRMYNMKHEYVPPANTTYVTRSYVVVSAPTSQTRSNPSVEQVYHAEVDINAQNSENVLV